MKCKEYFWAKHSPCHNEKNNKGMIFCPIDQRTINGKRKAKCRPEGKATSVTLPDGTIEIYDTSGERTAVIV